MRCENQYTVKEAAAILGMCEQALREQMKAGRLPIGIVITNPASKARPYTYHVYKEWVRRWLEGNPVAVPKGATHMVKEA